MARHALRRRMTVDERLAWARQHTPDGARLAEALCMTARVTPDLLRATRRLRFPAMGPAGEAEFWWGPLIAFRSLDVAFVVPEIASALRQATFQGQDPTSRQRSFQPFKTTLEHVGPGREPLVRIEDAIIEWLYVGDPAAIDRELDEIVSAIAREERPALCSWAVGLIDRIPELADRSTARVLHGLAYARLHGILQPPSAGRGIVLSNEEWGAVAQYLPRRMSHVRWSDGRLSLHAQPADGDCLIELVGDGDQPVEVAGELPSEAGLVLQNEDGGVTAVAFSPDGRWIVSGSEDGAIRVLDSTSGGLVVVLEGHRDVVSATKFSPDATRIVSSGYDGTARVWDVATRQPLVVVRRKEPIYGAHFLVDGTQFVTGGADGTVRTWDAITGEERLQTDQGEGPIGAVAVSPDGTRIASVSERGILRVTGVPRMSASLAIEGHSGAALAVAFSPDGWRIVSGGEDGTVRVWDAAEGTARLTIQSSDRGVRSTSFSPDGSQILSTGDDGVIRVWDATTGDPLLALETDQGWTFAAEFSPDGSRLVSGGRDGTVRFWHVARGAASMHQPATVPLPLRIELPDGTGYSLRDHTAANRRLDELLDGQIVTVQLKDAAESFLGVRVEANRMLAAGAMSEGYRGPVRFAVSGRESFELEDVVIEPTTNEALALVQLPDAVDFPIIEQSEPDSLPNVLVARAGAGPDDQWWSFYSRAPSGSRRSLLEPLAVTSAAILRRCHGSPVVDPRTGVVHGVLVLNEGEPALLGWSGIAALLASLEDQRPKPTGATRYPPTRDEGMAMPIAFLSHSAVPLPLQAGALAALQDRGVRFEYLVGTGWGLLPALIYVAPADSFTLKDFRGLRVQEINSSTALPPPFPDLQLAFRRMTSGDTRREGLLELDPSWVERYVDFSELKSSPGEFYINAYNLIDHKIEVFSKDQITADLLCAALSSPFIFTPYVIFGKPYIDASTIDTLGFEGSFSLRRYRQKRNERKPAPWAAPEHIVVLDVFSSNRIIRQPKDLYDSWVQSITTPLLNMTRNDLALLERKAREIGMNILRLSFDVPDAVWSNILDLTQESSASV